MATRIASAARQAAIISRIPPQPSLAEAANLVPRRGLAGAADHHGPAKINCWQDPMSPSKWKEEHFVLVSLTGWGLVIFGGYKLFTGGKGKKEEVISPFLIFAHCFSALSGIANMYRKWQRLQPRGSSDS
ncbi:hypothetical protein Dimus_009600 [Dionaea muscipula]